MSSLRQHHRCHPPRAPSRDRSIAGNVNTTNVPLALLPGRLSLSFSLTPTAPIFTRFLFPCASSSLSRTAHLCSRHSFFLFLMALSSSFIRHFIYLFSLSRFPHFLFFPLSLPLLIFFNSSPSRPPDSLERGARRDGQLSLAGKR